MSLLNKNINYNICEDKNVKTNMFSIVFNIFDIFKHYVRKKQADIEYMIDTDGKNLINITNNEIKYFIININTDLSNLDFIQSLIDFLSNLICVDDIRCGYLLEDLSMLKSLEEILELVSLNKGNFPINFINSLIKLFSNIVATAGVINSELIMNTKILHGVLDLNSEIRDVNLVLILNNYLLRLSTLSTLFTTQWKQEHQK